MAKMEYTPKSDRDNSKKNNSLIAKIGVMLSGMVFALGAGLYGFENIDLSGTDIVPPAEYEVTVENEYDDETYIEEENYVVVIEEDATEAEDSLQASDAQEESVTSETIQADVRFRNEKLLSNHYNKHGRDMGFDSAKEYELAAAQVVANPNALHKTESEDGDDVYYLEDTNDFVIVSRDGYIRTYFRPDRGKAYYDKQ